LVLKEIIFLNTLSSQSKFFYILEAVDAQVYLIVDSFAVDAADRYSTIVANTDSFVAAAEQNAVLVLHFLDFSHD
jgi:hypothetical protein